MLERLEAYRAHLLGSDAKLVHAEQDATAILERAWRTFQMRRLVVRERDTFIVLPSQRPLMEYYANSIRHLLPEESQPRIEMHPARESDESLPRLRRT